jgi:hypothetical protein
MISKTELMLIFLKPGDSLLISFISPPTCFAICPLREENVTVKLQHGKLCQIGFVNSHGWAQTVEVKNPVTDRLIGLATDFYNERTVKLV